MLFFAGPYILSQIGEFLLNIEKMAGHGEGDTNITADYYSEYGNEEWAEDEGLYEKSYNWYYKRYWKADWKAPSKIIDDALDDLKDIENAVKTKKKYNKHNKYYDTITNWSASAEDFWTAVYHLARNDNEDRVELVSKVLKHAIDKNELSRSEAVSMILTFIQHIEYYIPEELYFQFYPPITSIMYNLGDCDTKSLLIAMIFEDLGYDAVMMYSSKYLHAMAAVNINGTGEYIEYKGKKYYIMETTAKGWKLGMLPDEMNDLRYWHPIDI